MKNWTEYTKTSAEALGAGWSSDNVSAWGGWNAGIGAVRAAEALRYIAESRELPTAFQTREGHQGIQGEIVLRDGRSVSGVYFTTSSDWLLVHQEDGTKTLVPFQNISCIHHPKNA